MAQNDISEMCFTKAEVITLLKVLSEAQNELCVDTDNSDKFPEGTAHSNAIDALRIRFRAAIPEAEWPIEY